MAAAMAVGYAGARGDDVMYVLVHAARLYIILRVQYCTVL